MGTRGEGVADHHGQTEGEEILLHIFSRVDAVEAIEMVLRLVKRLMGIKEGIWESCIVNPATAGEEMKGMKCFQQK